MSSLIALSVTVTLVTSMLSKMAHFIAERLKIKEKK